MSAGSPLSVATSSLAPLTSNAMVLAAWGTKRPSASTTSTLTNDKSSPSATIVARSPDARSRPGSAPVGAGQLRAPGLHSRVPSLRVPLNWRKPARSCGRREACVRTWEGALISPVTSATSLRGSSARGGLTLTAAGHHRAGSPSKFLGTARCSPVLACCPHRDMSAGSSRWAYLMYRPCYFTVALESRASCASFCGALFIQVLVGSASGSMDIIRSCPSRSVATGRVVPTLPCETNTGLP
ncbi:hypothetical protein F4780DRAFT_55690 [Xylariomycetidae sp. FL0641]|nr:hypothetical protein F4780DRAFT_55690 [Xylariomycetidae sp. FL0641]